MPLPSVETQGKVASEAADRFVEYYYEALNKQQRGNLAHFYVSTSNKLTGAGLKPDITFNGKALPGGVPDLFELLDQQGTPVHFDIQSYDAHPVNPNYLVGAPDPAMSERGDKLSFAVQVAGTVKIGKGEDAHIKAFNDIFVLVPHWEAQVRNAPRGLRKWVILSQNSRYL